MTISFLHIAIEALEAFTIRDPEDADSPFAAPVAVDDLGCVEVPATGLIGSLRSHLGASAERHLGSELPTHAQAPTTPSPLRALGTRTTLDDASIDARSLRVVTRTAIDRRRGAALQRTLRDTQEAPAGAIIDLWCEFAGPLPNDLLDAIATWQPYLGGLRTSGRGRAHVTKLAHGAVDPTTQAGLAMLLTSGGPQLVDAVASSNHTIPHAAATAPALSLKGQIVDGIFTAGERGNPANLTRPLTNAAGVPVLEGSSLKGILRSRVAFIASSVAAIDTDPDTSIAVGNRCAEELFGTTQRRGRFRVSAAEIGAPRLEKRNHVGIDRFTGGATDGLLFSEEIVAEGSFELTVEAIDKVDPAHVALLSAACRDIDEGYVGVGGKTSRGHGTVKFCDEDDILAKALPLPQCAIDWIKSHAAATGEPQ